MLSFTALMHTYAHHLYCLLNKYGMCYIIVAIYGLFHPQTHVSKVNTVETVLNGAGVGHIGQQGLAPLIC